MALTSASAADPALSDKEQKFLYFYRIQLAQSKLDAGHLAAAESVLEECPPELRHWEWRHLKKRCRPELFHVRNEATPFSDVVYSSDGKSIATSSWKGIAVFDAQTGKQSYHVGERGGSTIAYSHDGKLLAWSVVKKIIIAKADTGETVRSIDAHDFAVRQVAFNHDSTRLASCSGIDIINKARDDGQIRVWDVATGQKLLEIQDRFWTNSVTFTPDGNHIVSASGDVAVVSPVEPGFLKVWDAETGKETGRLVGHDSWITTVTVSHDGRLLASGSSDRTVRLWNLQTMQPIRTLSGHTDRVEKVAFSPSGKQLASCSEDRTVRLWDVDTGKELRQYNTNRGEVQSIAFSPKGDRLVSTDYWEVRMPGVTRTNHLGEFKVWDLTSDVACRVYQNHTSGVSTLSASPDGRLIAAAHEHTGGGVVGQEQGAMIVRDLTDGRIVIAQGEKKPSFSEAAFSGDGRIIAIGLQGFETRLYAWNVATAEEIEPPPVKVGFERKVKLTADGSRIVLIDKEITVLDTAGKEVVKLAGHFHNSHCTKFALSPDGAVIASGNWGGYFGDGAGKTKYVSPEVKLWNTKSGEPLHTLDGAGTDVVFSPAGKQVATAGENRVKIWDIATGKLLHSMTGHADAVSSISFSSDGKRIASASKDNTVKIWDVELGLEVLTIRCPVDTASRVLFTPADRYLITGGHDGSVRVWDAVPVEGK